MKVLALELDIPVVAMAQLNRAAERQRPSLNMLSESGDIEQHADKIIFLHRDREKEEVVHLETRGIGTRTECIVAKNRNGETGVVQMLLLKECLQFVEGGAD